MRFSLLIIVFLATTILSVMIGGSGFYHLSYMLNNETSRLIVMNIRLPRVLLGALSGMALGLGGLLFQAYFRNPLATPFTLGISGGAAFGAVLAIQSGIKSLIPGLSPITFFAFLGAMLSSFIIFFIAGGMKKMSSPSLLLAGVAVSFFFSAMTLFLQYVSDYSQSFNSVRWLMGGLSTLGFSDVMGLTVPVFMALFVAFFLRHELNILLTGEEMAQSRGVKVKTVGKIIFFTVSLSVGAVVALCGPIGFVGMMIPHICRLIFGGDHKILVPATALSSASFLIFCDTISRYALYPAEIPVGVITSMLGGPFFLWLLLKK